MRRHAWGSFGDSFLGTGSSRGLFGRAFATRGACSDVGGSGARSHRPLALTLLLAFALSVLVIAPAVAGAAPDKAVTGYFGSEGSGAGQLFFQRGVAVNQASGNVYSADLANNRIVVFDSSGTFLRAFGQDVVASGPGDNGTGYEICVPAAGDDCQQGAAEATGGALGAPIGIAIDQLSGDVYVTEAINPRVQQFDADGNFIRAWGQDVVASGPGDSPATSAVQSLTVTATAGKYTLGFGGQTTPELPHNATAAEVQTALLGLTSIGAGNVEVTGASFPYAIAFTGALANNPEPTVVAASGVGPGNELEGGTVSVVSTTSGSSGFEICVAADGDVCQAGATGGTGGAFEAAFGGTGYLITAPVGAPNAGNVLVADPANQRVQEFTSTGAFVRTFGFDVAGAGDTGTDFEVCAAVSGDACKAGVAGSGAGQFDNSVNRVAEDAAGNIYTVESGTNFRVQKFTLPGNAVTPQGTFSEANLTGSGFGSAPEAVAIDPSSENVLVLKSFPAGATPSCPNTGAPSLDGESRVVEVSAAGALQATHMACAGIGADPASVPALATRGSSGDIYVSVTDRARIFVLNTSTPPSAGLTEITGVGSHEATVTGFVNPNGPTVPYGSGLHTSYRIAFKRSADADYLPAQETDVGIGTTNVPVSRKLTGLFPNTSYDVTIVAARPFAAGTVTTAVSHFTTPAAGPDVTTPTATATATESGGRVAFNGTVNPNAQATTYRFEYGTDTSYGTQVPAPEGSLGSGGASLWVAQYVTGLEANTTYHYRLVAKNATGETPSPDRTFTTPPLGGGLPHNRGAELVSPADKRPVGSTEATASNQMAFQAGENGDSMGYVLLNGLQDSTAGGEVLYSASRLGAGWSSKQVTPPALIPPPVGGNEYFGRSGAVRYFSPEDIKCAVVETHNPLSADTPQADIDNGVYNLYRWNAADGTYTLITNRIPFNPTGNVTTNKYFEVVGASADCSKVFFRSMIYKFLPGENNIYEWDEGVLRQALNRPDGSPFTGNLFGSGGGQAPEAGTARNNVSPDGRFVFAAASNEGANSGMPAAFVRKSPTETVDATQPTNGPTQGAGLETASPDGSHVFFLGNYGIAATSSSGPTDANCTHVGNGPSESINNRPCDLYDYDVETGELTDISVDPNAADFNGAVVQGVFAVSDDGSSVYFAARGQLVPGQGRTYAQNLAGPGFANVYLYRNGSLTYVGGVTAADIHPQSGGTLIRSPLALTSKATKDGDYLLFPSRDDMTGTNPAGTRQVYLFSAETGSTACVSCALDGAQPRDSEVASKAASDYGKYTPRALGEDGTVVFGSEGALTPGAVEGQGIKIGPGFNESPLENNVYEWRQGQLSLLATGPVQPLDVGGPDGRDVFVRTYRQLIPADIDFSADVYDLRVGGGFAPPPPPPVPCDPAADQCQGPQTPAPAAPGSATAGVSGPGNPPLPKKKHKKKHHKKHAKKHKKKGHQAKKHDRAVNTNRGGSK